MARPHSPSPKPEPIETSVAIDSFHSSSAGTGTLTVTATPTNDGEITGVVVAIVTDDNTLGTTEVDAVTVEGLDVPEVAPTSGSTSGGASVIHALGSGIPTGPLDVSVTVTAPTAKRAGVWLLYGEGDVSVDTFDSLFVPNTTLGEMALVPTVDDTIILSAAWESDTDVANISPGTNYTNDLEHDFGTNTAAWQHRTTNPVAGSMNVSYAGVNATNDYNIVAVAMRVGVGVAPGGSAVVREDLATVEDPTGGNQANFIWRKVDSAFATFSGDFNWTSGDLQHVRRTTDPDPHIAVDQVSPSTHYRRVILSEAYLAGALTGSPTTLAVTADAAFPIPTTGICSIEGLRAFTYSGRTGSFPNYTLTGVSWINATPDFSASDAVRFQSTYDAGVPNDSYRAQMQRWSASPSNTFYAFQPGTRRQIVWSQRHSTDDLPWPSSPSGARRHMVMQFKPSPSGGTGPILSMRQYGDTNELEVRHDITGVSTDLFPAFEFDPEVGWLRFMMDITFGATSATGRFQLFGDLDGDRINFEDMVPISEQIAAQTCFAPGDPQGEVSGVGFGPYGQMLVPAHWMDFANIQVIDPE